METIDSKFICNRFQSQNIDVKNHYNKIDQVFKYSSSTDYIFYYPFNLEGDESLYNQLEKKEWYYIQNKWEHKVSKDFILYGDSVLEIGCADGSFLEHLHKNNKNDVIGLELNKNAISKASLKGIKVINQTIQQFAKVETNKFDVVCFFQVLEHISDVHSFLKASISCLKTNGRLIISVPNNNSFIRWDKFNPLNLPPHHMGLWNENSLKSIAELFNLKVVKIVKEPLQKYHIDWYMNVLINNFVPHILLRKVIDKFGIKNLLKRILCKTKHKITGHSIMFIYEK